ncbi:MAG TPA: multiheme c-type cytochrome [Candidatus Omnitrophota bacterium]|nr:multiheme c-type cytochrome [Candidatus Omnitrophota bacterium]
MVIPKAVFVTVCLSVFAFIPAARAKEACVDCHKDVTAGIVADWKISAHAKHDVSCSACHGSAHNGLDTVDKVLIPTAETCGGCHKEKLEQFKKGKHAVAWKVMKAMPTLHWQPMALIDGMKGCGGCHKIGLKSSDEVKQLRAQGSGFGVASCDSCHTRHTFSEDEARQPQACATCHMGFDHPQWEMYSTSKHGVRYLLKQNKVLPETAAAPSCQTCHVQGGNHENRAAWGFLAVRLPFPDDEQWKGDRTVILQALGVLDREGKPTARLDTVKETALCRLSQDEWLAARRTMIAACRQCHSAAFTASELSKGDAMIREADRQMAEAIRTVAGLYKDGLIKKPHAYMQAFPDLLAFHDAPTPIETKLFLMFMEYRMRAFQGAFHMNPDYAFWYGWSSLRQALTEIKALDEQMRRK